MTFDWADTEKTSSMLRHDAGGGKGSDHVLFHRLKLGDSVEEPAVAVRVAEDGDPTRGRGVLGAAVFPCARRVRRLVHVVSGRAVVARECSYRREIPVDPRRIRRRC